MSSTVPDRDRTQLCGIVRRDRQRCRKGLVQSVSSRQQNHALSSRARLDLLRPELPMLTSGNVRAHVSLMKPKA